MAYERNVKKETEWRKQKYKRLVVDIDKDTADNFINKLNGKPYSEWIKEHIKNFLK